MFTPVGDEISVLTKIQQSLERNPTLSDTPIGFLIGRIDMTAKGELIAKEPSLSKDELLSLVGRDLRRGTYVEVGVGPFRRRINRIFTSESPYIGFDSTFGKGDVGGGGTGGWGIRDESHAEELTRALREANDHN